MHFLLDFRGFSFFFFYVTSASPATVDFSTNRIDIYYPTRVYHHIHFHSPAVPRPRVYLYLGIH